MNELVAAEMVRIGANSSYRTAELLPNRNFGGTHLQPLRREKAMKTDSMTRVSARLLVRRSERCRRRDRGLRARVVGIATVLSALPSAIALADASEDTVSSVPSIEAAAASVPFEAVDAFEPALVPIADTRALLGWAIHLSDYRGGVELPEVRVEPEAFFVANACLGRTDCRVLGWYADRGVVHLHERVADMDSLFARSLLVHELVHYLQHASGRFAEHTCESFVAREREAYAVQQAFFVAHGAVPGIRPHHFGCVDDGGTSLAVSR